MPIEPRAQEIAQIERELEILRARYALMGYWGRVLKVFISIVGSVTVIAVIASLFVTMPNLHVILVNDSVVAAFVVGMIVIVGVLLWIARDPNPPKRPYRWIDLASPIGVAGWFSPYPRSEAQAIEDQIAAREQRLALRGGLS